MRVFLLLFLIEASDILKSRQFHSKECSQDNMFSWELPTIPCSNEHVVDCRLGLIHSAPLGEWVFSLRELCVSSTGMKHSYEEFSHLVTLKSPS